MAENDVNAREEQRAGVCRPLKQPAPCANCRLRVAAEPACPVWVKDLNGRVDRIGAEEGLLLPVTQTKAQLAHGMAGQRHQFGALAQFKSVFDEFDHTCLDEWHHAVCKGTVIVTRRRFLLFGLPVVEFAAADQITRLAKGRHPPSVDLSGVPADMVRMQMRAHHDVDVVR